MSPRGPNAFDRVAVICGGRKCHTLGYVWIRPEEVPLLEDLPRGWEELPDAPPPGVETPYGVCNRFLCPKCVEHREARKERETEYEHQRQARLTRLRR